VSAPAPIARVAVIGAGQIGMGVAEICAASGLPTALIDIDQTQLDHALRANWAGCFSQCPNRGFASGGSWRSCQRAWGYSIHPARA